MADPPTPAQPPERVATPVAPAVNRGAEAQLRSIGKGLVQSNLKLSRVLSLLEQRGPGAKVSSSRADSGEVLFDLLDALDAALATEPGLPARRRLFGLLPPAQVPAPDPRLEGLRVARRQAIDQLAQLDIHPVPVDGPLDPRHHRVIGRRQSEQAELDGQIACEESRGWRTVDGRILRPACVTVWITPPQ